MRLQLPTLLACAGALGALAPLAPAQTLLGMDGTSLQAWEFSPAAGGSCPAPNPFLAACPYSAPMCGTTGPGFAQPGTLFGDIADDPRTDTFYLTDGFIIQQYTLDNPCTGPMACAPLNQFPAPSLLTGPITGMGFDNSSSIAIGAGTSLLWVTDGRNIVALAPGIPGSCSSTIMFGPCVIALPTTGAITDLSWDHSTDTIFACDSVGFVHNIDLNTCTWLSMTNPTSCGLTPPLTGIACDLGTPADPPLAPSAAALYVTDGNAVARVESLTGLPAAGTFGAPTTCTPTPAYLSGLALTQHGSTYGNSRANSRLDTFGQAISPSTSFGLEVYFAPPGANAWLLLGYNWPTPGFFCPAVPGAGTKIWVDIGFPGSATNLGPLPGPCVALPSSIPAGVPDGLEIYAQVVFVPTGGPPAVDATNGVIVTVMTP